jgi:hypothetical protein
MKLSRKIFLVAAMASLVGAAPAQNSNQHFAKDGLSFDYPAGWATDESKSSGQMQYITLGRDGYAMIVVRAPRALVDTPDKETNAKKVIQEGFVDAWIKNFEGQGAKPERSAVTTEIGGGPAECTRLSASLEGEPGRVDICYRLLEKKMVQISIIGSTKDITRTAPAWDSIRNSLKIEPPAQKPSAAASPSPAKP